MCDDLSVTVSDASSAEYWEGRYRLGGDSGVGSFGRLATFKAAFVNSFIELNAVRSVVDFGCGDGNQLDLLSVPRYTGIDVSASVLARCRARFTEHAFVDLAQLGDVPMADLGLSLDVIFHLTEDPVFADYMHDLFALSRNYVIIYSSNFDAWPPDRHVRHRLVSAYVRRAFPDWTLRALVPNRYPFDPCQPQETSLSDFLVFGRGRRDCRLLVPSGR